MKKAAYAYAIAVSQTRDGSDLHLAAATDFRTGTTCCGIWAYLRRTPEYPYLLPNGDQGWEVTCPTCELFT